MSKIFAIGDIHGNYKALLQCINRSGFNPSEDTLIGIGDYVDGHSESLEVVEYLMKLPKFIGLLGNHDLWCLEWLIHSYEPWVWVSQGGKATLKSFIERGFQNFTKDDYKKFFSNLSNYYVLKRQGRKYGFVHAGWSSVEGLGKGDLQKTYIWDRNIWKYSKHKSMRPYVRKRWGDFDYIFIGHTADKQDPPVRTMNNQLINLDQGAGWHGKLTICDIDTFECWQSDESKELYSDFKGR